MNDASRENLPLRGYAVLSGVYTAAMTTLMVWGHRRQRLPSSLPLADVALLGVATHQGSRMISRSKVLTYAREPFTVFEGTDGALPGEAKERRRRGGQVQSAVADLIVCPYCMTPWVAAGLFGAYVAAPSVGRLLGGVLSAVTIADFMHTAYVKFNKD